MFNKYVVYDQSAAASAGPRLEGCRNHRHCTRGVWLVHLHSLSVKCLAGGIVCIEMDDQGRLSGRESQLRTPEPRLKRRGAGACRSISFYWQ